MWASGWGQVCPTNLVLAARRSVVITASPTPREEGERSCSSSSSSSCCCCCCCCYCRRRRKAEESLRKERRRQKDSLRRQKNEWRWDAGLVPSWVIDGVSDQSDVGNWTICSHCSKLHFTDCGSCRSERRSPRNSSRQTGQWRPLR